jgi:VWFA-related protein
VAAALVARQSQDAPTFRAEIEAVQVDVYVTDAAGNPVSGLTVDDFEVIENGTPQPITTFEAVDIPIERAEPMERVLAEPDVLTNDMPLGRVYLFALDEVQAENILRTRRFVRQFIEEHFGPNDLGAIALLGRGLATSGQDFTGNRRLLLNAIDQFSGGFERSGGCGPVRVEGGRGGRSTQMESLRSLAELMARIPGRHKAMLLFTECLDVDVLDLVDYNGGVLSLRGEDAHAAMAAATRSNLAIYPIDPTGLSPGAVSLENIDAFRSLGEATGGFALINSNSFKESFERIVRDNSTYYMLAFNSAYEKDDGRYVRVAVKVKRPGLTVRTREGYVAPNRERRKALALAREREPASAVAAALASPLATRGVAMRVFAAPFKGRGRNATVAVSVEMNLTALDLRELDEGVVGGKVDVRFITTDAKRNVYPEVAHTASIEVRPHGQGRLPIERMRVRVVSELELPQGRYQVRVAAGSRLEAGNVVYDLEVPDFSHGPLAVSGLSLITSSEPTVLTLRSSKRDWANSRKRTLKCYSELCISPPKPADDTIAGDTAAPQPTWLDGRLPGPPTTVREFSAGDNVEVVAEIYDNEKPARKGPPRTLTLSAELRAEDGRTISVASETRPATARSSTGGHMFTAALPLRDVTPGQYVLTVWARSNAREQEASRAIPIRVK